MGTVFDAIYYQALLHLNRVSPGAASLDVARDYLAWAWPAARASRPIRDENDLFEQAAFVIDSVVVAQ
jgi:hypothetical protein